MKPSTCSKGNHLWRQKPEMVLHSRTVNRTGGETLPPLPGVPKRIH
jgi:hypothetical protein